MRAQQIKPRYPDIALVMTHEEAQTLYKVIHATSQDQRKKVFGDTVDEYGTDIFTKMHGALLKTFESVTET